MIKGSSPQAFKKNVETEMKANPGKASRAQNLAIAYSVKRKAMAKKKAMGGEMDPHAPAPASGKSAMHKGGAMYAAGGEINFHDERRVSEDEKEMRSQRMTDDEDTMHAPELDARDEHHVGEDDEDSREMMMREGASDKHAAELAATEEHHVGEDDEDSMEMDMMHQKGQPDEYSKAGIINYAKGGIAEAIRRKRMYAKGGMVEDGQVDLQDNADEHLNEEDQLSFQAPRKKTYFDDSQLDEQPLASNEHAIDPHDADQHGMDMISEIRRRAKMKKMK